MRGMYSKYKGREKEELVTVFVTERAEQCLQVAGGCNEIYKYSKSSIVFGDFPEMFYLIADCI